MKAMNYFNKRIQQRGVGLLELMLSLALISGIVMLATRYYGSAQRSNLVSQTASEITDVINAANSYLGANNEWDTGFDLTYVIQSGLVPNEFTDNGTAQTVSTPFSGVNVTVSQSTTQATITLSSFAGDNKSACYTLAHIFNTGSSTTNYGRTATCSGGTSLAVTINAPGTNTTS